MERPFEKFDRYELKYYIHGRDFARIVQYLSAFMTLDAFSTKAEDRHYNVNSLYFETHNFYCYRQKFNGLHQRRKFRVRFYKDNASELFVEVKKRRDCFTEKDRIRLQLGSYQFKDVIERPDVLSLAVGSDNQEKSEFFYFLHKLHLRPFLWVAYNRMALVGKVNKGIRITFDRNLAGSKYYGRHFSREGLMNLRWGSFSKRIIMEIKFRKTMPYWLEMFIKEMNISHRSISKYALIFEKCVGAV
jgi:hypothetical protein